MSKKNTETKSEPVKEVNPVEAPAVAGNPAAPAPTEAEVVAPYKTSAGDGKVEDAKIDDSAVTHDPKEAAEKAEASNEDVPVAAEELPADATTDEGIKSLPTEDSNQRLPFLK